MAMPTTSALAPCRTGWGIDGGMVLLRSMRALRRCARRTRRGAGAALRGARGPWATRPSQRRGASICASRSARSPATAPAARTVRRMPSSMLARLALSAGSIFGMAASAPSGSSTRLKYCSRSIRLNSSSVRPLVLGADLAQRVEGALVDARSRPCRYRPAPGSPPRAAPPSATPAFSSAMRCSIRATRSGLHSRPRPRRFVGRPARRASPAAPASRRSRGRSSPGC